MEPFALALDLATGRLAPHTSSIVRRVSDMRGMYADGDFDSRADAAVAASNLLTRLRREDVVPEGEEGLPRI